MSLSNVKTELLLLVICFANFTFVIVPAIDNTQLVKSSVTNNVNIVKLSNTKENETKVEKTVKELSLEDYRKKYNNSDIVGILSVKNTKINTLLLQTEDNDYYLVHIPTLLN